MKRGLLLHPPDQAELERLYHELAGMGAPSVGRRSRWPYRTGSPEELVALAGEMLRYDPRLLTILLQLVLERWDRLNPVVLRRWMEKMRWPQALLVVFEFARGASGDPELRHFANYLSAGWRRVEPAERFFLDVGRPASRSSRRAARRNLRAYARWGFLGSERPSADVHAKRAVGRYDARTRASILDELISGRGQITVSDYVEALDHTVSRQQAVLDLRAHPRLALSGRGRGSCWRVAGR